MIALIVIVARNISQREVINILHYPINLGYIKRYYKGGEIMKLYCIDKRDMRLIKSCENMLQYSAETVYGLDYTDRALNIAKDCIGKNGYFIGTNFIYGTKENLRKYFKV